MTLLKPANRRAKRAGTVALAALLSILLPVSADLKDPVSPEVTLRLAVLDTGFRTALDAEVLQAHRSLVSDLDTRYAGAVDQAFSAATSGSRLEDALALKDEKDRLSANQPMPDSDGATVRPVLAKLRSSYRATLARLEADRDRKSLPAFQKHRAELTAYQNELTQKGRLNDAVAVSQLLKSLVLGKLGTPLAGTATGLPEKARPAALATGTPSTVTTPAPPAASAPPGQFKFENKVDLVPLELGGQVYGDTDRYKWETIPQKFAGAEVWRQHSRFAKTIRFTVNADCVVHMACTSRWMGTRPDAKDGATISEGDLIDQGWKPQEDGILQAAGEQYQWKVFARPCKAGESFAYRTEIYLAPFVIVPKS